MNFKLPISILALTLLVGCVYSSERDAPPQTTTRPVTANPGTTRPSTPSPVTVRKSTPLWGQYYTVGKSEGLYRIAVNHGLTLPELAEWNGLYEPYNLNPGQKLRLFPRTGGPSTSAQLPTPTASAGAPASSGFTWSWPAQGNLVAWFQPGDATKQGIGISGRKGDAVKAAADGVVIYSSNGLVGYGELVIVKHTEQWLSAYGLNNKRLVKEGDVVKRGQAIAEMGSNGNVPQLHFEIRYNGKAVDPRIYLPRQ